MTTNRKAGESQPSCLVRGGDPSRHRRRALLLPMIAALLAAPGCSRAEESGTHVSGADRPVVLAAAEPVAKKAKKKGRGFSFEKAFDLGGDAARIYDDLRTGRDVRLQVNEYTSDEDDEADQDLLNLGVLLCGEGTFELSMQEMAMKTVNVPAFMLAAMPGQAIPQKFKALLAKRPEWKEPLAEMVVDLIAAGLERRAAAQQSLLASGDEVLFCADPRFEAPGRDKSGFDRVVIGYFSLLGARDEKAMLGMLPGTMMMTQKTKITDFFTAARWNDHLGLALAADEGAGERNDDRMEGVAAAFEDADLQASALMVRSVWMKQRKFGRARTGELCLERITRSISSGQGDARRAAVALGYWAQAVADPRDRIKPETHAKVQGLLQSLARHGALYDATVLAYYLEESGFELPLPDSANEKPGAAKAREMLAAVEQEKSAAIRLAMLEDAVATGDATAMLALAQAWEKGKVGHIDVVKARAWCEKAAEAGLPAAYNQLGVWAEFGMSANDRRDPDRARAYYVLAANRGDAAALCNAARVHQFFARRPIDANIVVALYEGATRLRDPMAMCHLGLLYFNGTTVAVNDGRALELWREAAGLGCALAEYNLALCHLSGRGVPKDPAQARALLENAAKANMPAAKYRLGILRTQGLGGPADRTGGAALIAEAAQQGYEPALEYQRQQRAAQYAREMERIEQQSFTEQLGDRWQQSQSSSVAANSDYLQWQVEQKRQAWRSQLGQRIGLPVFFYGR